MTRKRRTRAVDKNAYRDFLVKAKDFASMMDVSIAESKWNSAGLQAVHADKVDEMTLALLYLVIHGAEARNGPGRVSTGRP